MSCQCFYSCGFGTGGDLCLLADARLILSTLTFQVKTGVETGFETAFSAVFDGRLGLQTNKYGRKKLLFIYQSAVALGRAGPRLQPLVRALRINLTHEEQDALDHVLHLLPRVPIVVTVGSIVSEPQPTGHKLLICSDICSGFCKVRIQLICFLW